MDGRKLSLASLCAAAILFFFPWLVVDCQGVTILTQTGAQTLYGGGSASDRLENLAEGLGGESGAGGVAVDKEKASTEGVGMAFLAVLSALTLLIAITLYAAAIGRDEQNVQSAEVASLVAAGLLVLQAVIGFPIESEMQSEMAKQEAPSDAEDIFGASPEMAKALGSTMIGVKYQPTLYFTILAMLGGGAALLFRAIQKKRPAAGPPPQAVPPPTSETPPTPADDPN